jgi:hypothetical protein
MAPGDSLRTIGSNRLIDGEKIDNLPSDTTSELALKEDIANKGQSNGYAGLDSSGKVPASQLPSSGSGDVSGPGSSVTDNFSSFADNTGKNLKDSGKNASDFATAAQGGLADTAVQPAALASYVPYTGATGDLDLGVHELKTASVRANSSAGVTIHNSSGQDCALFGAGGGQSATFYDGVKLDAQTASRIASFDASKNLAGLDTATYPSLAELAYVKGLTSSAQTQLNGKQIYHGVVARPVGASNPLPTHLTTTTFTLGATANPISYYYQGILVNVTADKTATLDDGTAGLYYVYFNAATGNILATKNFPGIDTNSNVIIATVNWNGTDYGLVNDERHSYSRCTEWHVWAHATIGARYVSGLTLTHNGGTGAAATFATTAGEIADEDIQFSISASSAFPTANTGRLLYQTGASSYAFVNTPATTPGYLGANNRPNVVSSTGYGLTQLSSAVNRYINVFVYATTDLHTPIYFFTETASAATVAANGYTSVANARAAKFPNLSGFGLSPELKPIYRLIWRADGVLQAIDVNQDDYRLVSSLPQSAGTTSTTASAVTFNPSGNISATTVQTAIEELDSEKAIAGDVGSSGLTMSTARLLGRTTASTGAIEEISVSGATLSGGVLTIPAGGTGFDVTIQGYSGAMIANIPLGSYSATTARTLAEVTVMSETLPVGTNCTIEIRKNSTSS